MRRRLTLAICGMVAAALLAAGLGTLALSRLGARDATRKDLARQASAFAQVFEELGEPQIGGQARTTPLLARQRLQQVASTLKLEDIGFLVAGANLDYRGDIPAGLALADLKPELLRNDQIVTGYENGKVFAAAPGFYERTLANGQRERVGGFVVVITSKPASVAPPAVRWFLLASIGTLLLGALVAFRLTRTLTKPVVAASATAHRIATGDLAARVPEPAADATDELSELSRSINAMASGLERSRGLERQFLMSVSHDLRTPMASIQGYAEALVDEAIDPRRAGDVILAESKRLDRLVTDLLLLSRADSEALNLRRRPVDLGQLAQAVIDRLADQAAARDVMLRVDISPGAPLADADAERIEQVLRNLLDNALKYSRPQTTVTLGVSATSDRFVLVQVRDEGIGIPAADLPRIGQRFYRADRARTRARGGHGLGLAIAQSLVRAHGGQLWLESEEGVGTTASFTLPSSL